MTDKLRILVVDDNALLRDSLCAFLDAQPGMEVIGQAGDGHEALTQATRLVPDVILLDVIMPGMNGREAVSQLKHKVPTSRVVTLSAFEDEESARDMLEAGADAYVRKSDSPSDFITVIRRVTAAGGTPDTALTQREREVLKRFAQGYPLREIAEALGLELATVQRHKSEGMAKLKLKTRAEVARVAAEQGWG
jgi:DNA-binding NarL/FixJ family response regulator